MVARLRLAGFTSGSPGAYCTCVLSIEPTVTMSKHALTSKISKSKAG